MDKVLQIIVAVTTVAALLAVMYLFWIDRKG